MHQSCSEKIRSTDPGGVITFDSTLFPAAQQVDCSVVIQQRTYGLHYPSGILFRFSDIDIDGPCQNNNITITDESNQGVQGRHAWIQRGDRGLDPAKTQKYRVS